MEDSPVYYDFSLVEDGAILEGTGYSHIDPDWWKGNGIEVGKRTLYGPWISYRIEDDGRFGKVVRTEQFK